MPGVEDRRQRGIAPGFSTMMLSIVISISGSANGTG
jgi:hypothetical protein